MNVNPHKHQLIQLRANIQQSSRTASLLSVLLRSSFIFIGRCGIAFSKIKTSLENMNVYYTYFYLNKGEGSV